MSVLKDMVSSCCGAWREAQVEGGASTELLRCFSCGEITEHSSHCTGGVKLKPFITAAAFAGRNWSDEEVKIGGFECTTNTGEPIVDLDTGNRIDEREEYGSGSIAEMNDEVKSDQAREKGRTPIFFDSLTGGDGGP